MNFTLLCVKSKVKGTVERDQYPLLCPEHETPLLRCLRMLKGIGYSYINKNKNIYSIGIAYI